MGIFKSIKVSNVWKILKIIRVNNLNSIEFFHFVVVYQTFFVGGNEQVFMVRHFKFLFTFFKRLIFFVYLWKTQFFVCKHLNGCGRKYHRLNNHLYMLLSRFLATVFTRVHVFCLYLSNYVAISNKICRFVVWQRDAFPPSTLHVPLTFLCHCRSTSNECAYVLPYKLTYLHLFEKNFLLQERFVCMCVIGQPNVIRFDKCP